MAYSAQTVAKARQILEGRKADKESQYRQNLLQAYREQPRLKEIDMLLRQSMAKAAQAAFLGGGDAQTALEAVKQAKVPILLIHGEADAMVPCEMAHALKEACASPVTLLTVPGAAHGICFYVDNDAYCAAVEKLVEDALQG